MGLHRVVSLAVLYLSALFSVIQPCRADYMTIAPVASKWGDTTHGTVSGTIRWSFMDDMTALDATHPLMNPDPFSPLNTSPQVTGLNDLTAMRAKFGVGVFDGAVQSALNTWAAAAPGRITFQQVADPGTGVAGGSLASAALVDIRIGAFTAAAGSSFDNFAAVGYGPPGFGPDGLAGDLIFNLNKPFFVAPGAEGAQFYFGGAYTNDIEGLALHELGHAIGLAHSSDGPNFPGVGDVMYVDNFPDCCNFVNRQLSSQDIAGAQSIYGVPEPSSAVGVLIMFGCCTMRRRRIS